MTRLITVRAPSDAIFAPRCLLLSREWILATKVGNLQPAEGRRCGLSSVPLHHLSLSVELWLHVTIFFFFLLHTYFQKSSCTRPVRLHLQIHTSASCLDTCGDTMKPPHSLHPPKKVKKNDWPKSWAFPWRTGTAVKAGMSGRAQCNLHTNCPAGTLLL